MEWFSDNDLAELSEWIRLMQKAKREGVAPFEVRSFLRAMDADRKPVDPIKTHN